MSFKRHAALPLAALLLAMFGGCTVVHPVKYYEGAELPKEKEGWIKKWDSYEHTGNRVSYDWISHVISVDGKLIQNASWARLLPGDHKVKMMCEMHPRLQKIYHTPVREFDFKVEANRRYYPWCGLTATLMSGSRYASPVIPGAIVGDVREGVASPYLDTKPVP